MKNATEKYQGHYSVLKAETVELLAPENIEASFVFIDGTLGEGGHTAAMLQAWPNAVAAVNDADDQMIGRTRQKLDVFGKRVSYHLGWFDDFLENYKGERPQVIFLDLGISMFHFLASARGFSFRDDTPLDMRLSHQGISAGEIVNSWSEKDLADLFRKYADEKEGYYMACTIVNNRPIHTARQLGDLIYANSKKQHYRIHPATKIFQALRIFVNQELFHLEKALPLAFNLLTGGGKLGIISFHSLEDRLVKNYFRDLSKNCHCPPTQMKCTCHGPLGILVNPGGTVPIQTEIEKNPASRSARLRVIQKRGSQYV